MRSSSRGQKSIRKSAAKARPSVAQVPPDITINARVLVKAVEGEEPLPGTILFIGPTQFAEGTWLGVELDEPKGKNSGTVQDVSYFTARPNHGLFVRAGKVQKIQEDMEQNKQPLESEAAVSYFIVGARVLVRPAENSAGTIRFVGSTEFADGEWFGVELDNQLGKNDGTVKGVSYFSCPAMHGIFARREHLLEAPASPSTSPASPSADASPATSSKLLTLPSTSPTATPKEEIGDTEFPAISIPVDRAPLAVVEEMKAEVERLRKELQQYKALEDSSPQPAVSSPPSHITRKMKETFENEIDHFLERRTPLWPRALSGPTGFGISLREKAMQNENTFRDIASTASQLWQQLDEDAKKVFRERHQAMVRLRSKTEKRKVVKQEHWKLESPGVSRHSQGYFCTVKEVRQIGADSIELDFAAEGDGSKGPLQLWLELATSAPPWCEVAVYEPRARGFRPNEAWDQSLEERAEDAFRVMRPAFETHASGGVSEGAPFGFLSHGVGGQFMALVAYRLKQELNLEPLVVFANDGPPPNVPTLSEEGYRKLCEDVFGFYRIFQPDVVQRYEKMGGNGSAVAEAFVQKWSRGLRLFEEHARRAVLCPAPYHKFDCDLHVLVAKQTADADSWFAERDGAERQYWDSRKPITGSAAESGCNWDRDGFKKWSQWTNEDFHYHEVDTDHMTIKNSVLMREIVFKELGGFCGMDD